MQNTPSMRRCSLVRSPEVTEKKDSGDLANSRRISIRINSRGIEFQNKFVFQWKLAEEFEAENSSTKRKNRRLKEAVL
jgi:hypothetical protein